MGINNIIVYYIIEMVLLVLFSSITDPVIYTVHYLFAPSAE